MNHPLRIDFTDDESAFRLFDEFPPDDLPYVEGWSRKRHGASQVLLRVSLEAFVELAGAANRREPSLLCLQRSGRARRGATAE